MAIDYAKLRDTSDRLITENGRTVILIKRDRTAGDVSEPWRGPATPGTDVNLSVTAVIIDFETKMIDGTLIRLGDKRAFISPKESDAAESTGEALIEDFDTLIDRSETWQIVNVDKVEPGGIRLLYDLQLRGAK